MKHLLLIVFLAVVGFELNAQDPAGLRRPSVKYHQINTDTVRIIYPVGMDSVAQRVAHLTTTMARTRPLATGSSLRKIDILLQNATDIPNGYVGLGPWRSEFYLTPPQNSFEIGSLPWHDVLALHEYRHVQQLSASRKGISSLFYYLFGEEAFSGAVHLAVPDWYTEGDAVVAETALSRQGRGRLPSFTNAFHEEVKDGRYWRYSLVRNGSFRQFIPDHYPLGYLILQYGRDKHGQDFWDSVFVDAASYKPLFYPFSGALKKRTGLNTKQFYHQAMDYHRNAWFDPPYPAEAIMTRERYSYNDQGYPVFDTDGTLYYIQQRFDQLPAIYRILPGSDPEKVVTPGFQTEPFFYMGNGKLFWTELRRHPRWWREDYNVIMVYDIESKSKKRLTDQSSYFMPALAKGCDQIVVMHDNNMQQYALQILSAETGTVLRTLPNPDNLFFTYPQWYGDDRLILSAARLADGRMTLVSYDLRTDALTELIPPQQAPIGRPFISNEWIYFTMSSGDVDQIFRVHRSARYFEQVTFDDVSKYQPAIDPATNELIYARYSLNGKNLIREKLDEMKPQPVHRNESLLQEPEREPNETDLLSIPQATLFPAKKYPLLSRPIRLHSWSLYSDDPSYGIELLSENTLNTLQVRGGWEYNRNSGYHGPFTELTFGLWYPEIVAGYSATRIDRVIQDQEFIWWQHVTNAGLRIPFYSYSGPYSQFAALSSRFNHISTTGDVDFQFDYLSHTLQFTNARRQAYQHAESRFSQRITGRILHSIDTLTAKQFYAGGEFNIPSPVRNHFFSFEADYKHELVSNELQFSDIFEYARGYDPIEGDDIWRFGASYQFPVAYPDFGIAGLVYLKRIRFAPFFDIMGSNGKTYRSVGGEIYFDTNVFNVEEADFGIRIAKRLDGDEGTEFTFILPTAL